MIASRCSVGVSGPDLVGGLGRRAGPGTWSSGEVWSLSISLRMLRSLSPPSCQLIMNAAPRRQRKAPIATRSAMWFGLNRGVW